MSRHSIAIVIHDGVQALDVAGPLDVFAEANGFVDEGDGYDISVIGSEPRPMRSSNGLSLTPDLTFDQAGTVYHTVLVAGGPALPDRPDDPKMSSWLRDWGSRAPRYGSICTGAFALGHAGLLDGKRVTTHWQNAHRLATMFPQAQVEHDRIYLRDEALVTSAGVTAGIDLALSLVAEDYGAATSLSCAKRLVVAAQRQGGQSQFSPFLLPPSAPDTPLAKVQAYVMANPGEPFPMERLAQIAGTSVRSLSRLFAAELEVTPHEFVESVRIDRARNLLEGSGQALKAIAFECGFCNPEQMRAVFQRHLGISPAQYRGSFQATNHQVH